MVAEASQGRSLRLSGCDAGDRPAGTQTARLIVDAARPGRQTTTGGRFPPRRASGGTWFRTRICTFRWRDCVRPSSQPRPAMPSSSGARGRGSCSPSLRPAVSTSATPAWPRFCAVGRRWPDPPGPPAPAWWPPNHPSLGGRLGRSPCDRDARQGRQPAVGLLGGPDCEGAVGGPLRGKARTSRSTAYLASSAGIGFDETRRPKPASSPRRPPMWTMKPCTRRPRVRAMPPCRPMSAT